jgi:hypothetical protein
MSKRAELKHAYTGYVDEITAKTRRAGQIPLAERTIDVGQRVRMLPPWFGSAGQEKGHFAERFASQAAATSLAIDISTREEDAFAGSAWYSFLGSCRATIGQKGGASLCDPTGEIMRAVLDFTLEYPDATFAEVEAACFPGLDNQAEMKAISPRLFDAAMLGTAQILIEDDYLGELDPWVHYIPTDTEVSNMDEIREALGDVKLLERLTDATAEALISSGKFTYRRFVEKVFNDSVRDSGLPSPPPIEPSIADQLQWRLSPDLFEGVQRISYLAWATEATSQAASLVDDIDALLSEDPALAEHLDSRLLDTLIDPVAAPRALDQIRPALVDIVVECFLLGASALVARWLRAVGEGPTSEWQLFAWIDQDRIVLDEEASHATTLSAGPS